MADFRIRAAGDRPLDLVDAAEIVERMTIDRLALGIDHAGQPPIEFLGSGHATL
jgi:hypothetical protein